MYSTADPLGTGNSPAVDVSYGWKGLLVMIIRKYMVPTNHMVHGAGILTMQHSSTSKMCRHVGKYTVHWAYGVYLHSYTMLYLAFTWKDIQMIFNLTISGWKIAAEVFKYIPKCRCINMEMTWVSSWKMVPVMLIDKVTQLFIHIWYLCHLIILDPRWHSDFKHKQQATWTNWPPKAVSAGDMVGPKGSPLSREAAGRWAKSGSMAGNRAPEGCRKGARTRLAMFHCFGSLQDFRCGHWMHLFLGTQTELEQLQLTKFAESDFTNFLSIVFGTSDNFRWFSARPKNKFATLRGEQRHRVRQSPQVFPVSLW